MSLRLPPVISQARADHILYGDASGGGHAPGAARAGHTPFPAGWSDQAILDVIAEIATDPTVASRASRFGRTIREADRGGVTVRVVLDANGQVITGFPV